MKQSSCGSLDFSPNIISVFDKDVVVIPIKEITLLPDLQRRDILIMNYLGFVCK